MTSDSPSKNARRHTAKKREHNTINGLCAGLFGNDSHSGAQVGDQSPELPPVWTRFAEGQSLQCWDSRSVSSAGASPSIAPLCLSGSLASFHVMGIMRVSELDGSAEVGCYNRRMVERTLAIIKPDAVERRLAGRILQRIEDAGFQIRAMRLVHLSKGEAEGFYTVHRERSFFSGLTGFMSSGPAVVMVLEAPDAIRKWRTLMGATDPAKADAGTLRKEFAQSIERNATHGSDAPDTAAYEIGYFFAGVDLI